MRRLKLALCILLTVTGCTKTTDEILIGEIEAMSGGEAAFGTATNRGVQMALDEINAAGGVRGKKLRLLVVDDQGKTEETALAGSKLITQDKVLAVLSGGNSTRMLAVVPIAQRLRVPFVATGATNPRITAQGDYIFRTTFIDTFQGAVMARFARESLKASRVAVLKDMKSDYSIGLTEHFVSAFKKAGGELAGVQTYNTGEVDFRSQLTSLMSKRPDVIFIPGSYTEAGLIARQTRELSADVKLLGADGWDSPKLTEIAGTSIAGSYFSAQYSPQSTDPRVKAFIEAYKARHGSMPDVSAALGYDGAKVLVDAIGRAAELTPVAVREALAQTKDFVGATGTVRIDEHRDAIKPATIIRVDERGKFRFHSSIQP